MGIQKSGDTPERRAEDVEDGSVGDFIVVAPGDEGLHTWFDDCDLQYDFPLRGEGMTLPIAGGVVMQGRGRSLSE